MCSITAYVGMNNIALKEVISSLSNMTYRGYDSAGVSGWDGSKTITTKTLGVDFNKNFDGKYNIAIGQTRWATRGKNDIINANPQTSGKNVAVVMNGTLDNYDELRKELEDDHYVFVSNNDTEVIAHLTNKFRGNMRNITSKLRGRYTCIIIYHGRIRCVKCGPSLILGKSSDGMYISSDVMSFIEKTDTVCYLKNNVFVYLDKNWQKAYDIDDGKPIKLTYEKVAYELATIQTGDAITRTEQELEDAAKILSKPPPLVSKLTFRNIAFTGSGSSYHAALFAEYVFRNNGKTVTVFPSCEYGSYNIRNTELVVFSQSGETGDVLRAVDSMSENRIIAVTNNEQSYLANIADDVIPIGCGQEIGVAATKSFMAQSKIIMEMAGLKYKRGRMPKMHVPENILSKLRNAKDVYILGSGLDYIAALEGSLKMKELLYIHAEAMFAGEFKHGPLAVLDDSTVVMVLDPDGSHQDTINEITSRGGYVIILSDNKKYTGDNTMKVSSKGKDYEVFIREVWTLQMIAILAAINSNHNVDKPRHLAKCVTV